MNALLDKYFSQAQSITTLALFRMLFGAMMLISIIRFWSLGWITDLYISPKYHFTYYGFSWVKPLGSTGMHLLFLVVAISAFTVMIGFLYRISISAFFLGFTYIELIDKTTYLNHYYAVSIISLIMIFLPAHRLYSLDVRLFPFIDKIKEVPRWCVDILKIQLGIIYFYAGIAKLNPDWLVEAMPLKIWLKPMYAKLDWLHWIDYEFIAYTFSWSGAIYDLMIPFLLVNRKLRPYGYLAVIIFHLVTRWLFPIGMFPYIMIVFTLIFFQSSTHQKILSFFFGQPSLLEGGKKIHTSFISLIIRNIFIVHLLIQLIFPFRYFLYPGKLFWTEEGFRFSWRVMLIEKAGYATFFIKDKTRKNDTEIYLCDHLTALQQKMMATQPDMILQFAHYLGNEYKAKGWQSPEVYADVYVTLNGRHSSRFIDPKVDLLKEKDTWKHKSWIIPYEKSKEIITVKGQKHK